MAMRVIRLSLLLLICLMAVFMFAEPVWHQFSSYEEINALALDPVNQDILWIGTNGGLVRYNFVTEQIQLYDMLNSNLLSNIIVSLDFNSENVLWVATKNNGLAKMIGHSFVNYTSGVGSGLRKIKFDDTDTLWILSESYFYQFNEPIDNMDDRWPVFAYDFAVLSSNDVWTSWSYEHFFISHYDGEEWTDYTYYQPALAIDKDHSGYFWILRSNSAYKFLDITDPWIPFDDLPLPHLKEIYIDQDNNKWFYGSRGIIKYDDEEWTTYTVGNSGLPANNILSLIADGEGNGMWIGTSKGLARLHNNEIETIDLQLQQLPSYYINDALVDQNGNVWFATNSGIGRYIEGYEFSNYSIQNSPLTSNTITSLAVDSNNVIWIGTFDGLFRYDNEEWQHFTADNSILSCNYIQRLIVDNDDNLYVYTNSDIGWYHYVSGRDNGDEETRFSYIIHIDTNTMGLLNTLSCSCPVTVMGIDNSNNLWYNQREIIFFPASPPFDYVMDELFLYDGTAINWIQGLYDYTGATSCITPENNGVWISSYKKEYSEPEEYLPLFFYDEGEVVLYYDTDNSELPDRNVYHLMVDNESLWISTKNGAAKLTGDSWEIFNMGNSPLPSNTVLKILKDNEARIWFVTDNGVAVYGEALDVDIEVKEEAPSLILHSAYPNPFNPRNSSNRSNGVQMSFEIGTETIVKIDVYNIKGQHIRNLMNKSKSAGRHLLLWDAKDYNGKVVPTGMYLYAVKTDLGTKAGRVLILR